MYLSRHLVIPCIAVESKTTASRVGTLHIERVEVVACKFTGGIIQNAWGEAQY